LDPPSADVGAVYQGRVVSIAKFGAFINILPGRDGLLHISKLAPLNGGKRIGQVEDVLELGQALEVKVDDIDPQGKVSLSLVGDFPDVVEEPRRERRPERDRSDRPERDRSDRPERERSERPSTPNVSSSSFEASFEAELAGEIGDLGPGGPNFTDGDGGGRRSPRPRRR
jgi:polyribonucleotide nucleotidyltransferase